MRSRSAAIWLRLILIIAGLGVAAFIYAFPLYWLVATSLKGKAACAFMMLRALRTRAFPRNS